MDTEPLEFLPIERWCEALKAFKSVFPRGMSGYYLIKTQRLFVDLGLDYGFRVYCPFGNVWNGLVCFNIKNDAYEINIQCPSTDTKKLEDALRRTQLIDWNRKITFAFTAEHIIDCIERILADVGAKNIWKIPSQCFVIDIQRPFFENVSLPPHLSFDYLSSKHVSLVNSKWPHRYRNSEWYFQMLINAKRGYGLFKNKELVAWVFITEAGSIGHVYTLEDHRRMGYGVLVLKLISNILLKENKPVFGYCVDGNVTAYKMYKKLGFESLYRVAWYFINCSKNVE